MASGFINRDNYPVEDITITQVTPAPTGAEWNTTASGVFVSRSGHIVQVRVVDLDITTAFSDWATIATGLPPIGGNLYTSTMDFSNDMGTRELHFRVNTTGQLAIRRGTAGKRYLTTIIYLATSL